MADKRLRLIILGMMGRSPFGGQTWLYLNWIRAFAALGHDVWYIEDDPSWPYDPIANGPTNDCDYAVRHVSSCMERIGLKDRWAFRMFGEPGKCFGLATEQLDALYGECDALLNIVGSTDLRDEHLAAPCRIYVQTDPVTAELCLANGDEHTRAAFGLHDMIFTYGENYGAPDCGVPLNGIEYRKTRQPVDLDLWPVSYDPDARYFTTIGNYRQDHADVEYRGEIYRWSKHFEWEKIIDLPSRTRQEFELALKVDGKEDLQHLTAHGWKIVSPFELSLDIFGRYPEFFRNSRGQLTVAKDQNVRLRSGWFSERDACYLATGKPVVTQDTGFGAAIPTGEGLFAFRTLEEARDAIEAINADYHQHCQAARRIAEEYFAAPKVGAKLLEEAGLT